MKHLIKYIKEYCDIEIELYGTQIKLFGEIYDSKNKDMYLQVYGRALKFLLLNNKLNSISVYYLQDMITNYLKEVAMLNNISSTSYGWTSKLFLIYPEYQLFYNTVEGFKLSIQAISMGVSKTDIDYPMDTLIGIIDLDLNKYSLLTKVPVKPSSNVNTYSSSSANDIL